MQPKIIARRRPSLGMPAIRLTPRESDVLFWIGEGKSDWGIATILGVKPRTVSYHADNLRLKLCAANRIQLVRVALRLGLLAP